jgi:hypothetical protein
LEEKVSNRSSIEDSIIIHKFLSIKYVEKPSDEIKGFQFTNFLLSKELNEKFSNNGTHVEILEERNELPLPLSPICFHNIVDDKLKIPPYESWTSIEKTTNK